MQWICQGSKGEYSNWKIHVYIQSYYRIYSAAASAKSLQSCPTLCHPIDGSPPSSPVPGILQARTLEWVAISFYVHTKTITLAFPPLLIIERVLNITRIDCNKKKALFVHCKIPCSGTDINWNRTFSEMWETIFSHHFFFLHIPDVTMTCGNVILLKWCWQVKSKT